MATYLSLDEAAKALGIAPNELIDMRSRGEIFGFRDGSSWKFKSDEIERVQRELSGDVLDDDPGGSSILVSERPEGSSKSGIVLAPESAAGAHQSDLELAEDPLELGSDVALVPDPSSGSGLRLVNRNNPVPAPGDGDDDVLQLSEDDDEEIEIDASSLSLGPGSSLGLGLGSELKLADESTPPAANKAGNQSSGAEVGAGSDLELVPAAKGGTPGPTGGSDEDIDLGGDLELASESSDDLVLSSNSDLALSADSGINLMAPSDSGLSLEDEPLDLAGAGISGLELGSDVGSGSDVGKEPGGSGAGISDIDFGATEDFQLSPSDGMELEEDSGSQVIEIEDSENMGAFPADEFAAAEEGAGFEDPFANAAGAPGLSPAGAVAYRGAAEVPLANWQVWVLLVILLFMGISGLLVTDIVRNMWAWNEESGTSITSWFTRMIMSAARMGS